MILFYFKHSQGLAYTTRGLGPVLEHILDQIRALYLYSEGPVFKTKNAEGKRYRQSADGFI